jgi:hypothetical protein
MCQGVPQSTVCLILEQQPPVGQGLLNNEQYTAKCNRLTEQTEIQMPAVCWLTVTDGCMKQLASAVEANHKNTGKAQARKGWCASNGAVIPSEVSYIIAFNRICLAR